MTALTDIEYFEFDSTHQTLISDLLDKILTCASWSKISSTVALMTNTANAAAAQKVMTFTAGVPAGAGIFVGQTLRIGEKGAADCEYATVASFASTTVTMVNNLVYAHNTGTNVYWGSELLKSTTTRGADMIFDLMDDEIRIPSFVGLNMACWRSHTGLPNGGTDKAEKYLYFRAVAGTASAVVHCIVSVSKEHIFISLEGPHYNEATPDSATLGSARQYFFMGDLVPYDPADTIPAVVAGGNNVTGIASSFPLDLLVQVSRNAADTSSWVNAKLQTLATPANGAAGAMNVGRINADGNYETHPYVVIEDLGGHRGRLANFEFAGYVNPDFQDTVVSTAPLYTVNSHDSQDFKLLPMNHSGSNNAIYGPFGYLANNSNSPNNVVVAIPTT